MKKHGTLTLIIALVSCFALYFAACSFKDNTTSTPPASSTDGYASPTAAATSSQALSGALSLSAVIGSATDLAGSSIPQGYAPSLRRSRRAVDTASLSGLDSRLQSAVDRMIAMLQNSTLAAAAAKAPAFATQQAGAISAATVSCSVSGTYDVSGTDTSTQTYSEASVTVTFNSCRNTAGSDYTVLSGTIAAYHKAMLDQSSDVRGINATNLSLATYVTDSLTATDVIQGSFSSTDNVTSGRNDANGTFTSTASSGVFAITFSNASDVWTQTSLNGATTSDALMNGSFDYRFNNTLISYSATIALTNLEDKIRTNADQSMDRWINGSVNMSWSPDLSNGACVPGQMVIAVADTTPIHTPSGSLCPTSGTMTVNNATFQYGVPSGTQVKVTVGTVSNTFADCNSIQGTCVIL